MVCFSMAPYRKIEQMIVYACRLQWNVLPRYLVVVFGRRINDIELYTETVQVPGASGLLDTLCDLKPTKIISSW